MIFIWVIVVRNRTPIFTRDKESVYDKNLLSINLNLTQKENCNLAKDGVCFWCCFILFYLFCYILSSVACGIKFFSFFMNCGPSTGKVIVVQLLVPFFCFQLSCSFLILSSLCRTAYGHLLGMKMMQKFWCFRFMILSTDCCFMVCVR